MEACLGASHKFNAIRHGRETAEITKVEKLHACAEVKKNPLPREVPTLQEELI